MQHRTPNADQYAGMEEGDLLKLSSSITSGKLVACRRMGRRAGVGTDFMRVQSALLFHAWGSHRSHAMYDVHLRSCVKPGGPVCAKGSCPHRRCAAETPRPEWRPAGTPRGNQDGWLWEQPPTVKQGPPREPPWGLWAIFFDIFPLSTPTFTHPHTLHPLSNHMPVI